MLCTISTINLLIVSAVSTSPPFLPRLRCLHHQWPLLVVPAVSTRVVSAAHVNLHFFVAVVLLKSAPPTVHLSREI